MPWVMQSSGYSRWNYNSAAKRCEGNLTFHNCAYTLKRSVYEVNL